MDSESDRAHRGRAPLAPATSGWDTLRVEFPGRRVEEWPVVGIFRFVDMVGDNLLAEFPSAVDAVRCALLIQNQLAASKSAQRLKM